MGSMLPYIAAPWILWVKQVAIVLLTYFLQGAADGFRCEFRSFRQWTPLCHHWSPAGDETIRWQKTLQVVSQVRRKHPFGRSEETPKHPGRGAWFLGLSWVIRFIPWKLSQTMPGAIGFWLVTGHLVNPHPFFSGLWHFPNAPWCWNIYQQLP